LPVELGYKIAAGSEASIDAGIAGSSTTGEIYSDEKISHLWRRFPSAIGVRQPAIY
jgi:hypothetical protein